VFVFSAVERIFVIEPAALALGEPFSNLVHLRHDERGGSGSGDGE
jgi:hypothetical protein